MAGNTPLFMEIFVRKLLIVLILCLLSALSSPACWAKQKIHLTIGDSYAFGYTTDNPDDPSAFKGQSYGEPGYSAAYAAYLQSRTSDTLKSINLSIPGETTTSFFTGGSHGAAANLHYSTSLYPVYSEFGEFLYVTNAKSQYKLLLETIQQARAEKSEIYRITIHLGGNDLQELLSSGEFVSAESATRSAMLVPVLARASANYDRLLGALRKAAPEARVILLSYPNPFRALGPVYQVMTDPLALGMNSLLTTKALLFDARFVDVYTPFLGHEGEWTYILDPYGSPGPIYGVRIPNAHLNALGNAVVANLLIAQEKRLLLLF